MTDSSDDTVYDEDSGEWMPTSEWAERRRTLSQPDVRDAVGNLLSDGDQVALITSIRLTGDAQEIDCKFDGIKGLVLRAAFVRKR